eukprot:SAG31_NODE_35050_length_326_cov_1.810573_1_plen_88_part_01
MLEFDDRTIEAVLQDWDPDGSNHLNYRKFCEFVMGSSSNSATSISSTSADSTVVSDAAGNSEQMLRRKVRENWKSLHVQFKHLDPGGT